MSRWTRRALCAGLMLCPAAAMGADTKETVQPGQPVTITVTTAATAPDVSLSLNKRTSQVTPCRVNGTHTGGGNIDVQQPSADAIVVTMTGAAVAYGSPKGAASAALDYLLTQEFEVSFDKPSVSAAKLTMEARVIGFLRAEKTGTAEQSGNATISGGGSLAIAVPSHAVCKGDSVSINDKEGPVSVVLTAAGTFCLNQTFHVAASMPRAFLACKAPSAEFGDAALDPLWISAKEPFKGA